MKNKQRRGVDFILLVLFILLLTANSAYGSAAETASQQLARADSLFESRRYTESFRIYDSLLIQRIYSPAMLLKMAFIQEGLGNTALSLSYLNQYYLVTGDDTSLVRMQKIASERGLSGYETEGWTVVKYELYRRYGVIAAFLAALACLLTGSLVYRMRRREAVYPAGFLLGATLAALLAHANLSACTPHVVVVSPHAYLMEGPSLGAPVVAIVPLGSRLPVVGEEDVWLRLRWGGRKGYMKSHQARRIEL